MIWRRTTKTEEDVSMLKKPAVKSYCMHVAYPGKERCSSNHDVAKHFGFTTERL